MKVHVGRHTGIDLGRTRPRLGGSASTKWLPTALEMEKPLKADRELIAALQQAQAGALTSRSGRGRRHPVLTPTQRTTTMIIVPRESSLALVFPGRHAPSRGAACRREGQPPHQPARCPQTRPVPIRDQRAVHPRQAGAGRVETGAGHPRGTHPAAHRRRTARRLRPPGRDRHAQRGWPRRRLWAVPSTPPSKATPRVAGCPRTRRSPASLNRPASGSTPRSLPSTRWKSPPPTRMGLRRSGGPGGDARNPPGRPTVIDFKTQKTRRDKNGSFKPILHDTWPLQLEAYRQALASRDKGLADAAIASVVIGSTEPVPVVAKVWDDADNPGFFRAFLAARDLWVWQSNYCPVKDSPDTGDETPPPRWSRPNTNHPLRSTTMTTSQPIRSLRIPLPHPGHHQLPASQPPSQSSADADPNIHPRPACGLGASRGRRVAAMSASIVARSPADRFLDLAVAGENTFLTGAAGSGKSHGVRELPQTSPGHPRHRINRSGRPQRRRHDRPPLERNVARSGQRTGFRAILCPTGPGRRSRACGLPSTGCVAASGS